MGLLLLACSICFLIELRITNPGITSATMDWALTHQSLIKKRPYSQILWRHFLNCGILLWDNSSLCQADTTLVHKVSYYIKGLLLHIPCDILETEIMFLNWWIIVTKHYVTFNTFADSESGSRLCDYYIHEYYM